MIELDDCCYCFPLRTGSLIIGYMSLVGGFLTAIRILVLLINLLSLGLASSDYEMGYIIVALTLVLLLFTLIYLAFTIILLVGLHKERRGFLKTYIIFASICLLIGTILLFVRVAMYSTDTLTIVGMIVAIVLNVYFLLVLRSYFLKMKRESDMSARST